jgi:hypothetical protein
MAIVWQAACRMVRYDNIGPKRRQRRVLGDLAGWGERGPARRRLVEMTMGGQTISRPRIFVASARASGHNRAGSPLQTLFRESES